MRPMHHMFPTVSIKFWISGFISSSINKNRISSPMYTEFAEHSNYTFISIWYHIHYIWVKLKFDRRRTRQKKKKQKSNDNLYTFPLKNYGWYIEIDYLMIKWLLFSFGSKLTMRMCVHVCMCVCEWIECLCFYQWIA